VRRFLLCVLLVACSGEAEPFTAEVDGSSLVVTNTSDEPIMVVCSYRVAGIVYDDVRFTLDPGEVQTDSTLAPPELIDCAT
jgi:hypothetical protein